MPAPTRGILHTISNRTINHTRPSCVGFYNATIAEEYDTEKQSIKLKIFLTNNFPFDKTERKYKTGEEKNISYTILSNILHCFNYFEGVLFFWVGGELRYCNIMLIVLHV